MTLLRCDRKFWFLLVALAVQQAAASEPTPVLPSRIDVNPQYGVFEPVVATVQSAASIYIWDEPATFQTIELDNGRVLHVWAPPGRHKLRCLLLTVDWDKRTIVNSRVTAEFVVGTAPDPIPPVPPPPPPPPDAKYQLGFFYERTRLDDLPATQREILAGLIFRDELKAKGHKIVCFYDQDIRGPNATILERLKPWFDAIKGDPLPRVAIAPLAGGEIRDFPLPVDKTALWKLLEKGGE